MKSWRSWISSALAGRTIPPEKSAPNSLFSSETDWTLRQRLQAPAKNLTQDLYVANNLKTGRVMVKDEDVCLHCGLCAERCPTGAWDMQKYLIDMTHAEQACHSKG